MQVADAVPARRSVVKNMMKVGTEREEDEAKRKVQ